LNPIANDEPAGRSPLGAAFARAMAVKDFDRIAELLDQEIEFRAVTPSRSWTADFRPR
jgi:hypothetical protein